MGKAPKYAFTMEERLETLLGELNNYDPGSEKRDALLKEIEMLSRQVVAVDEACMKDYDLSERRRIEQLKNDQTIAIERKKLHMPAERIALAVGEIVLPLIFASALVPFMAKYESENRVCTSIGREVWNLPKMFIRKYR